MKKKLLSLALALALSLSLAVPAFAAEEDKTGTTAPTESSGEEKKDETPAEGEEKKDEAPAEDGEKKDETPAEDGEKKDEAPAEDGEKKDEAPAEDGEKKDEAPAEDGEKKDEAAPKFTDVAADSPFAAAIDWAVAEGITTGKTETTFGPSDTCTVSHILTFLWRANGKPGAKEGVKDRDAALEWFEKEIVDNHGEPDAACTRSMAMLYIWQAAGNPETEAKVSFTDVTDGGEYGLQPIAWAVEKGITSGTGDGTTFSPDTPCTRGQIVTFLYRANQAEAAE